MSKEKKYTKIVNKVVGRNVVKLSILPNYVLLLTIDILQHRFSNCLYFNLGVYKGGKKKKATAIYIYTYIFVSYIRKLELYLIQNVRYQSFY